MIAVNATLSSNTTGAIESPMGSVPPSCTVLSLGLLTAANASNARDAGSSSIQLMDVPFETGVSSKEKLANVSQRYERYRTGEVTELFIALLKKDMADIYVNKSLKAQGVNTKDLCKPIRGLVDRVFDSASPLRIDLVMQALLKKIQQGVETPRALIEQLPFNDYERAAQFHQEAEPTLEDLARLLEPTALAPSPQARAGALTDEGQRKTIANQLRPVFGLSGVAADDLSIADEQSEREGFLGNLKMIGSGAAAGAVSRIRKSPIATTVVMAGGALTTAAVYLHEKWKSPQPASDATLNVTASAVTDLAWVTDVQQSGSESSEEKTFRPFGKPYIGYRRSDSEEEVHRRRENLEQPVLNR